MKKTTKLLFLLCACTIMFAFMSITAQATEVASGTCGKNVTWVLDNKGTLTISGTGDMIDWQAGDAPWYNKRESIQNVIVTYGVTNIGVYAFQDCHNLLNITIPDSVIGIGDGAFFRCANLESITIPDSVTNIGSYAFRYCTNLSNILISDNTLEIGDSLCLDTAYYKDSSNWESGVLYIGNHLITTNREISSEYVINTGTKSIADKAFASCNLTSITIPDSVISIGNGAFGNCSNLTRVVIPDSVIKIGNSAFSYCTNLSSIIIPDNTLEIGDSLCIETAYYKNSSNWESGVLYIGNHLITMNREISSEYVINTGTKSIADKAFASCNLTSITIPDSVITIGNGAFGNCSNLTSIVVDSNNPNYCSINGSLFNKDGTLLIRYANSEKYKEYVIPDSVIKIDDSAFSSCTNLTRVVIPDSVIKIGDSAFSSCANLTSITIPESVTNISNSMFSSCTNLTSITLSNSITSIYIFAFNNCASLNDVYYTGGEEEWNSVYIKPYNECITSATLHFNYAQFIHITGVTLNKSTVDLEKGKTETLSATVAPADATDKTVSWASSNTSVATVSNGKVTALKAGTAVITVTTTDGGYTANCTVTVTEKVIDENAPKITITDIKTMPGKEIQVTVDLANNTGFASLGIEVGYNSDIMTLTNVMSNTGVGGTFTKAQYLTVNPFNMGWDSASNITYSGNLATLTFTVGEDAPDGIYPITLDYYKGVKGNYVDGDNINYDENFEAVGFVYISGNVIVASYIPGDINGDESVDNKDATYLLRYLAGWSISGLVEDALDVDGSTSVDNKDATILLRYLAGWNVTLH